MGEESHISMDFDSIISVTLENYLDLQMKPEVGTEVRQCLPALGNSHLLLSILIKHLDHKNVAKQPHAQIHTVNVATQLTQNAKLQTSVAIIGAITDLIKQLRKCLQNATELSNVVDDMAKWNADLQYALENCISQLSKKVGDTGPILDMMSSLLENISNNTVIVRTTISAVHRTAQIVSSISNISYYKKASGKDTSQAIYSILPVSVSQKVRSGSFSFQDEGKEKEKLMDGGL
ncbi:hypothetical protein Patl1_10766 [Pistacia atlantica]|uniref:Uncharacterized protein n=1 Tax=Pistacia atlantica TaxID=434234 RepID=A0ACC1A050_9ROSI|nr:hypothetical protein Patl1_10766 [Pistacia atlantica]